MTGTETLDTDRAAVARILLRFARRGREVLAAQREQRNTPDVSEAGRPGTSGAGDAPTAWADAQRG